MQKKLLSLKSGTFSLPKAGTPDLPPVSLTSWVPRFQSLPLVLLNLLEQDLLPSRIIVWMSPEDYAHLDQNLIFLFEKSIVEFCQTNDYGPHKKWFPMTLETNQPFVICDDDTFYPRHWYRNLLASDDTKTYVAHRCHRIIHTLNSPMKTIEKYSLWEKDIHKVKEPSHRLFPVGCGGALIYPERISSKFLDWEIIARLCPNADDIWLKLAHLDNKVLCRKSNYSFPCIEYVGSQDVSLLKTNVDSGDNDTQLNKCLEYFKLDL